MRRVKFLVDSLADLPPTLVSSRDDIRVLDIPVIATKPGKREIVFHDLTADTFAEADELVQQGWITKTSMPQIYESEDEAKFGILSVERATKEAFQEGYDVLYLAINSHISGSYQAISALYQQINDEHPTRSLALCVDTKCASTGLAMLIGDMLSYYDANVYNGYYENSVLTPIDDVFNFVIANAPRIAMIFSWFEFEYIKNSGKVSALPAFLGKIFGIHPIGSVEYMPDGGRPLTSFNEKIRGTRKFFGTIARFIAETIDKGDEDGIITIAHGNCAERIVPLIETIKLYLPKATVLSGPDWRCGAAIQAHGGPTSIHINYHRNIPNSFEDSEKILRKICYDK